MLNENDNSDIKTTNLPEGWESTITPEYLIKFNKKMFVLHLIQGILMVGLGAVLDFSRGVYTFYFDYSGYPTVSPAPKAEIAFNFTALGAAVGIFLLMSSLAHFLLAWPLKDKYLKNIQRNYNPIRWFEYAFSSSLMVVLIAIFFTVVDVYTLFAIAVSNFLMNMFGWQMEKMNRDGNKGKIDWSPYILGVLAGTIPWIIITGYFLGTDGEPPTFVYAIYIVQLLLFNCFAFVMLAYYKKWGKFKDYAYGERTYQMLSLIAKTLLAWQVFAGVFQPS